MCVCGMVVEVCTYTVIYFVYNFEDCNDVVFGVIYFF